MEVWIVWLIATVILLVIEALTQTMWCLCVAAGTACATVASLCGADVAWQVVALLTGSVPATTSQPKSTPSSISRSPTLPLTSSP